ncbi:MAG TPA: formyltetrahydrofolate deformylase [Acidimicrobiales bacterium]|nr:formyltetrahydrofolate deformylase [Acidimicrobiales bacterium]
MSGPVAAGPSPGPLAAGPSSGPVVAGQPEDFGLRGGGRRLVLTAACPDRVGIAAAVSSFIAGHGGWVLESAQHGDLATGRFFFRIETIADTVPFDAAGLRTTFAPIAERFRMEWQVTDTDVPKRTVVLVSREDHCLVDLLYRWRVGDLPGELACVISNHDTLREQVEWHGVPFHHVPITDDRPERSFGEIARRFEDAGGDVMVLARFMRIVPPDLCERYAGRIVNIHHSFLPSFAGARPYHQAFQRGVKLIGATCHYVTATLDGGPIIEQDTRRVSHTDGPAELARLGRDVEQKVLARGLRWVLEDRVLLNGDRTVVFA